MCDCGAEDLPWKTCGSVDAGCSGEPEVDSLLSSLSESMVNSFGGSVTEIPSPCRTGRRADGICGYTIVHFFWFRDTSRNRRHHTEVTISCVITWLIPNHRISKRHRMPFVIQSLRKICCTFTVEYVRGTGFKLVAALASEIQMIRLFH